MLPVVVTSIAMKTIAYTAKKIKETLGKRQQPACGRSTAPRFFSLWVRLGGLMESTGCLGESLRATNSLIELPRSRAKRRTDGWLRNVVINSVKIERV